MRPTISKNDVPDESRHRLALCFAWRRALTPLVVVLALLSILGLSACGDDDSESDTQSAQTQTQTDTSDDEGGRDRSIAKFLVVRRLLNKREAEIEQLEADVDKANTQAKQANAEAEKATEDADRAEQQASSASDVAKAEAEIEQLEAEVKAAEAETREEAAKADAAAACAQSMLEIIAEVPEAPTLDEGVAKAADDLEALAPKCEDSVAGD